MDLENLTLIYKSAIFCDDVFLLGDEEEDDPTDKLGRRDFRSRAKKKLRGPLRTIEDMIEEGIAESAIPIMGVSGEILAKVLDYCKEQQASNDRAKSVDDDENSGKKSKKEMEEWEKKEFMADVDTTTLYQWWQGTPVLDFILYIPAIKKIENMINLSQRQRLAIQGRNKVALIFIVVLIAGFGTLSGSAARPLGGLWGLSNKKGFFLLGSLPRGPTPGSPECTNVPGNGGGSHCPTVNEMHYAVRPPVPASSSSSHQHFHGTVVSSSGTTSADN
ncbi:hypothetical protein H6P81_015500 [Aristolochia fimbriata]|uniref:SKP1 component POZ domain-containing protein n=1 Tax=Aristolochia fimbriata TaxID=158543 RepID=A0AAV7E7U0_ARIFI|nr:hypothetical protein H6P81_015500 [Aristolochia fimbriata]